MSNAEVNLLNNVRIVLVNPQHPGNIGMAARAMKNMGLSQLYLVNPKDFPSKEALYRASRADDVVEAAIIKNSLKEAVSDCSLVLGTSTRERIMSQTILNPREAALKITTVFQQEKTAIVFGCETFGLVNEDLELCQFQITIPSIKRYSSLNLASAVQVICYELRMSCLEKEIQSEKISRTTPLASAAELDGFYNHLKQTMIHIDFLNPECPRKMMERFRQIFNRALLDQEDVNLLRGMLSAIEKNR